MSSPDYTVSVTAHYGRRDLGAALLEALRAAGKDPDALTPDDLTAVDQFHTGGKPATLELLGRAALRQEMHVLDVGGGLGGPARTLATEVGCRVTVLDLTAEYCRAGEMLTARVSLDRLVKFQHGNALAMPFMDGTFDAAWTQNSSMNIADKERLYAEIHRVLCPGGQLVMQEIMEGPVRPMHFPVPWARTPAISFLRSPEETRALIRDTRFRELAWEDVTVPQVRLARQVRAAAAASPAGPPPVGLHLLLGKDFPAMGSTFLRTMEESRIAVIQAVFERA